MESYKKLIESGWCPIWTGTVPNGNAFDDLSKQCNETRILVRLGKGGKRIWSVVEVSLDYDSTFELLHKRTALSPGSKIGLLPSIVGQQSAVRAAAICGIAPFTRPGYGVGHGIPRPSVIRLVGLDIEQSTAYRGGKFPPTNTSA